MPVAAPLRRLVLVSAALVALLACAGAGRKWDTTHANDVTKGVQDKAQIRAWFGEPYQSTPLTRHPLGCSERWTYTYAWSNWGGAQTRSDTLVVDFDANGVVCDHAYVSQ
jgi:outer membrane protein assembly factor BamE (lipoprotein component of BamABCDE complex)